MFETIKRLFQLWTRRDLKHCPKDFENETKLGWNLYGLSTEGTAHKEFYRVHLKFKYWLIYPLMIIAKRIFKKTLDTPIPHESYNQNLLIFDAAYDKSIEQWYKMYLPHKVGFKKNYKPSENLDKQIKSNNTLRLLKKFMYKIVLNDSAYREFLNLFCHNIARGMLHRYGGKNTNHLFYTNQDIYDVTYVVGEKFIKDSIIPDEVTIKYHKMEGEE